MFARSFPRQVSSRRLRQLPVACTVSSGQFSSVTNRRRRRRSTDWLPVAYRPRDQRSNNDEQYNRKDGQSLRFSDGYWEDRRRLVALNNGLIKLAKEYRNTFSADNVNIARLDRIRISDSTSNQKQRLQQAVKQLKTALCDIHKSEVPIEWSQIVQSDGRFRNMVRALREIVLLACRLGPVDETNSLEYCKLAEESLRQLIELRSERVITVDAARNWSSRPPGLDATSLPPSDESRQWSSLKKWVSTLFISSPPKIESPLVRLAHEDSSLLNTRPLFHAVSIFMCNTISQEFAATQENVDFVRKLSTLLQLLPASERQAEFVVRVLEINCRFSTYEFTQTSLNIFAVSERILQGKGQTYYEALSWVFGAFLNAARRESDPEVLAKLASEIVELSNLYVTSKLSKSQCASLASSALGCLAQVAVKTESDIFTDANDIAALILDKENIKMILKAKAKQTRPKVDVQLLPFMDRLVQCYATSNTKTAHHKARTLLSNLVSLSQNGKKQCLPYPSSEVCNAVFRGMGYDLDTAGVQNTKPDDNSDDSIETSSKSRKRAVKDFDFVISIIDSLLRCDAEHCWPTTETFDIAFCVMEKTEPVSRGERAELLLSKMEATQAWAGKDFRVSRSDYHRVMSCWAESAKHVVDEHAISPFMRCINLVERLESNSTPMLFETRHLYQTKVDLYDPTLDPSKRTYKILLMAFKEDQKNYPVLHKRPPGRTPRGCVWDGRAGAWVDEAASESLRNHEYDMLLKVVDIMTERDMISSVHDKRLLKQCKRYLPPKASKFVQDTLASIDISQV